MRIRVTEALSPEEQEARLNLLTILSEKCARFKLQEAKENSDWSRLDEVYQQLNSLKTLYTAHASTTTSDEKKLIDGLRASLIYLCETEPAMERIAYWILLLLSKHWPRNKTLTQVRAGDSNLVCSTTKKPIKMSDLFYSAYGYAHSLQPLINLQRQKKEPTEQRLHRLDIERLEHLSRPVKQSSTYKMYKTAEILWWAMDVVLIINAVNKFYKNRPINFAFELLKLVGAACGALFIRYMGSKVYSPGIIANTETANQTDNKLLALISDIIARDYSSPSEERQIKRDVLTALNDRFMRFNQHEAKEDHDPAELAPLCQKLNALKTFYSMDENPDSKSERLITEVRDLLAKLLRINQTKEMAYWTLLLFSKHWPYNAKCTNPAISDSNLQCLYILEPLKKHQLFYAIDGYAYSLKELAAMKSSPMYIMTRQPFHPYDRARLKASYKQVDHSAAYKRWHCAAWVWAFSCLAIMIAGLTHYIINRDDHSKFLLLIFMIAAPAGAKFIDIKTEQCISEEVIEPNAPHANPYDKQLLAQITQKINKISPLSPARETSIPASNAMHYLHAAAQQNGVPFKRKTSEVATRPELVAAIPSSAAQASTAANDLDSTQSIRASRRRTA